MTADEKDQAENVLCVSLVILADFCFCLLVSVAIILFPTKTFFVEILNFSFSFLFFRLTFCVF